MNAGVSDSLQTRTAIVTGGAQRIGAAIVTALAKAGFNVCIHYASSEDKAKALADDLAPHGGRIITCQADLSSAEQTRALFETAAAEFGSISLLVNNASVFEPDSAASFRDEIWDAHFDIHLKAPARLCSLMHRQEAIQSGKLQGLVVNMIDQRVLRTMPTFFSYTLSKSALWTATRSMAQGFAPHLRVNAIGPGPTLPNSRQTQEDFDRQVEGLILKRGPELDDFGKTILYLWQTPSITGQMIALDGGQHLAWQTPDIDGIRE